MVTDLWSLGMLCLFLQIVVQQSAALGCTAEAFFDRTRPPYPPLVNDEGAYQFGHRVAAEMLGEENVLLTPPQMFAEDFSMYLHKIPGAFLFIGVANSTPTAHNELHSPYFYANEDVLPVGAALHSSLALSYLQHAADIGRRGTT